jgi:uncharacterized protein (TIGR02145 family)
MKSYLAFIIIIAFYSCQKYQPPTCKIINPSDGSEYYLSEKIMVTVETNDPNDNIREVKFYINNAFVNSPQAYPYSYEWNTKDAENGIHVIKAIVIDKIGAYARDEVSISLISKEPPKVIFAADQTKISLGKPVQFTEQSTNKPTSWLWNFGDGDTSSEQNPSHEYLSSGVYSVALTVTNNFGSSTETKSDYIIVLETGRFTDSRDGKTYVTIKIGDQLWMAENLAYLPSVNQPNSGSVSDPYYYVHGYEGTDVNEAKATENYKTYGVLYNWPAAIEACPNGWHLPSDEEWKELEMFLGMSQSYADTVGWRGTNEGSKLADGSTLWDSGILVNNQAFATSGFSALPGGFRLDSKQITAKFLGYGYGGYWWSSTEYFVAYLNDYDYAMVRHLASNYCNVARRDEHKDFGFSVRCVKD